MKENYQPIIPEKNRAVIYCRVSSKEQVIEGNSLTSQERLCKEYAFRKGYEIIETFFEKGESAKTDDRTELEHLFNFCFEKTNNIHFVIFYKVDRWARDNFDYNNLKKRLKTRGIVLKSATEDLEDTPAGRFYENILASQAQFDNELRIERCTLGMKDALREGRFCWMAPIGYENVRINGKATLAIHPVIGPKVRKVFELVAQNNGPTEDLRKKLTVQGLVNRNGKPISKSNFYVLLKNELYIGKVKAFGEIFQGSFEPLVSIETFEQVQRVLKLRGKRSSFNLKDHPDFPLRRFVTYPTGEKLTGSWSQGRKKKYAFYRFGQKGINLQRDGFELEFMKFLDTQAIPLRLYPRLMTLIDKHLMKGIKEQQQQREELQKRTYELKNRQNMLITKNFNGVINDDVLKQQLALADKELTEIYKAITLIPYEDTDIETTLLKVRDYLNKPSKIWRKAKIMSQIKLQWFQFPKGITFDGEVFGTTETSFIYKTKSYISASKSDVVHPPAEFWNRFIHECKCLSEIIDEISSE